MDETVSNQYRQGAHVSQGITTTPIAHSAAPAKPLMRGRSHQLALLVAIPAGILLVRNAPSGSTRLATAVYAVTLIGLFATSAAYHRRNWSASGLHWMRRLDHSMIYLFIAGTNTAYTILVLDGIWQWLLLLGVWAGAIVGITLKFVMFDGFGRIGGALYIALGWIGVVSLPQALQNSDGGPLILVGVGGLMYTIGAVVLLRRRPDPSPMVFGYHEIWHALVIAASACQFTAITMLVRSA